MYYTWKRDALVLFTKLLMLAADMASMQDGTTVFSIRKGALRNIVEQIVSWLVRPPGSSKASRDGMLLFQSVARLTLTNALVQVWSCSYNTSSARTSVPSGEIWCYTLQGFVWAAFAGF